MTSLHIAEWLQAIVQHVFRKLVTRAEANRLTDRLNEHRSRGLWREAAVPEHAFEVCAQLARKPVGRLGVRTLETLHLASARELGTEEFWTFDDRQRKWPEAMRLRVV